MANFKEWTWSHKGKSAVGHVLTYLSHMAVMEHMDHNWSWVPFLLNAIVTYRKMQSLTIQKGELKIYFKQSIMGGLDKMHF